MNNHANMSMSGDKLRLGGRYNLKFTNSGRRLNTQHNGNSLSCKFCQSFINESVRKSRQYNVKVDVS